MKNHILTLNQHDMKTCISLATIALYGAAATLLGGCISSSSKSTGVRAFELSSAEVYLTARDTLAPMSRLGELRFESFDQPEETQPYVFIDPSIEFQRVLAFGGAITDASVETFAQLSPAKQQEFLAAYYDPVNGIGYDFGRINIASCDFSSSTYSYIAPGDTTLVTFNIAHDEQFRIPFIKQAMELTQEELLLFGSPWSPPGWMKSNGDPLHGGKLLDECKQAWANHYVKFIEAYRSRDIPVWGITVQNEPMAVQIWESCIFTAEQERDFIRDFLGPTLEKSSCSDVKLIAWDHNRDLLFHRAAVILADREAARYVWGFGYHWYEPWTGGAMQFDNLGLTHQAFPDKELIFTEGCVGRFDFGRLGDWSLGARYGNSILNDLNNGMNAWCDWNILLDEKGGPNHVENYCFAPIHADTRTGELIYTNSYYYIGHFSKFIARGARRIAVSSSRYDLQVTGARNPDGSIVVVALNNSPKRIDFRLGLGAEAAPLSSPAHSIMTIILKSK